MKCTICEKEIENCDSGYMDNILLEEHASCKDDNHFYSYKYATGNYRETIGNVSFYRHYRDPVDKRALQDKQYREVLKLEKEHVQSIKS